ncbi:MAG TPA: phosphotransferase family protein [Pseudonocardiaceae bacterium]|nr:phosphotransferase family protein [Pseudonocardiaceae bacterium]
MPMLEERDLVRSKIALLDWLHAKLGEPAEAELVDLRPPEGSGFSSETLIVTANWSDDTGRHTHELVVRLASTRFRVVREVSLTEQAQVMRLLAGHSTVPVPEVLWYEEDPSILGGPFLVIRKLPGRVPGDQPPYHEAGWLVDTAPADRTAIWWSAVDTLVRLHSFDTHAHDLSFLAGSGAPPLRGLLDRLGAQQDWVAEADLPEIRQAREWLLANQPAAHDDPVLLWGDARIGNMLFTGTGVTGALDWEKAMVGPREIDLAWFLYVDRHHSEGCRLPRLAGMPEPAETIARYQELTGHVVRDLPYFEVLSGYHFALLMIRAVALLLEFNILPTEIGANLVQDNSSTRLLRTTLSDLT